MTDQHRELLEDALRQITELKRNADELRQRIQELERQPKMAVGREAQSGQPDRAYKATLGHGVRQAQGALQVLVGRKVQ